MSWGITYTNVSKADEITVPPFDSEAAREQFDVARSFVIELIGSKVLGTNVNFNVSISGHANPGHTPTEGWVNDYLSIAVNQAVPAVVPVEASSDETEEAPEPAPAPEAVQIATPDLGLPAPEPVQGDPGDGTTAA